MSNKDFSTKQKKSKTDVQPVYCINLSQDTTLELERSLAKDQAPALYSLKSPNCKSKGKINSLKAALSRRCINTGEHSNKNKTISKKVSGYYELIFSF